MNDENDSIVILAPAPFPMDWQGVWVPDEVDESLVSPGDQIEIDGRSLSYFGETVEFITMIGRKDQSGQLTCIEIDAEENQPQFLLLNHIIEDLDKEQLLVANSQGDSKYKRRSI